MTADLVQALAFATALALILRAIHTTRKDHP